MIALAQTADALIVAVVAVVSLWVAVVSVRGRSLEPGVWIEDPAGSGQWVRRDEGSTE